MKTEVTVQDDSYLMASCMYITPEMRQTLEEQGTPIPMSTTLLPNKVNGKIVMEPRIVPMEYEGAGLTNAIKRAKRWINNKGFISQNGIPNHINLAMAAFRLADKPGFDTAIGDTV